MRDANRTLVPRSALGTVQGQTPGKILETDQLQIFEEPFLTVISLRQSRRLTDNSAVGSWLDAIRLNVPRAANELSGDAQLGCCWFEPNAWLITSSGAVKSTGADAGLLATTISDRLVAFRINGPLAMQVISAGCDPTMLKVGACARTRFAEFATVLMQRWNENDFRMLVDVSIARDFAGWLLRTGRDCK